MPDNNFPGLERRGPGVFYTTEAISLIGPEHIAMLKEDALDAPLRRSRICLHHSPDDPVQEMIIAIGHDSYIPPHRHLGKSESFHVIEGEVEICFFTGSGTISEKIRLGAGAGSFCYRLASPVYHTPMAVGDITVIHEIVTGPFAQEKSGYAPFAPDSGDTERVKAFMARLRSFGKNSK